MITIMDGPNLEKPSETLRAEVLINLEIITIKNNFLIKKGILTYNHSFFIHKFLNAFFS